MIEELEAEAVVQMVAEERGGRRLTVTCLHDGNLVEVMARRRKDGGTVLAYSYEGARLERATLLALICPHHGCEESRSTKQRWKARTRPVAHPMERRPPRLGPNLQVNEPARLAEEWTFLARDSVYIARPASFAVPVVCPAGAHKPYGSKLSGWDVFESGRNIAGGLVADPLLGATPVFPTLCAVAHELARMFPRTQAKARQQQHLFYPGDIAVSTAAMRIITENEFNPRKIVEIHLKLKNEGTVLSPKGLEIVQQVVSNECLTTYVRFTLGKALQIRTFSDCENKAMPYWTEIQ